LAFRPLLFDSTHKCNRPRSVQRNKRGRQKAPRDIEPSWLSYIGNDSGGKDSDLC